MTVVVGLRGALSRHLHVTVPADAAKSRSRAISSHRQQTYAGLKIKVAEEHLRMSFWFWSFASFARYLVFAADSTGIVQFQNGGYSSRQRSRELGAAGIVHAEVLYRPFSCFYDSHEFLSLHPSPVMSVDLCVCPWTHFECAEADKWNQQIWVCRGLPEDYLVRESTRVRVCVCARAHSNPNPAPIGLWLWSSLLQDNCLFTFLNEK